jgi:AcrR family transcriptional regulator
MARPRSKRAHDEVLDAALDLFAERGIDATSMDAIADASGVSKATIYKHWPDKDALCLEVLARLHGRDDAPPDVDTGLLRSDLVAVLSYEPPPRHATARARMMPHLMAHAARNPAFGKAWRARVLDPPRQQLTRILERGIERGQLSPHVNIDLAMALLLGPMMYVRVHKLVNARVPDRLVEQIVSAFLKSYGLELSNMVACRYWMQRAATLLAAPGISGLTDRPVKKNSGATRQTRKRSKKP